MKTTLKALLLFAAMLVLAGSTAQATIAPATAQKLIAADGAAQDQFGFHVSISDNGNTALIGAVEHDNGKGAAYVFIRAGDGSWSQQAKLIAADSTVHAHFGGSVAVAADGGTALIGADGDNSEKGSVYVFTRIADGTWIQQVKITAPDGVAGDRFGINVAVSADSSTALIGATGDDNIGSAYVFVRSNSTWTQQAKLTAQDRVAEHNDQFGSGVSISSDGNTALIGLYSSSKGAACIFVRSADGMWTQQAKLAPSDGAINDGFGMSTSVSADGSTALIGAGFATGFTGSAYVFVRSGSTWTQQTKLTASRGGEFGYSVSISADGSTVLIGAVSGDDSRGKGAAYVFGQAANGAWTQQAKLTAPDGTALAFGSGVSMSADGRTALIGAMGDNNWKGVAYVFVGPPWPSPNVNMTPVYQLLLRKR